MKDQISIGQVSRYFGIPRQTLRFYEQKGLIHSHRDPQSGYRYYHYADLNQLFDLLGLHQMGFGVPQMKELLNQADREDYIELLTQRDQEISQQINHLQVQQRKLQHLNRALHLVESECGHFVHDVLPASYFLPLKNYGRQMKSLPVKQPIQGERTFHPGCLIHRQAKSSVNFQWGLLEKQKGDQSLLIKSHPSISTVADLRSEGEGSGVIAELLEQVHQNFPRTTIEWPLVGQFILRCHSHGKRQRFIRLWFPVKKEAG